MKYNSFLIIVGISALIGIVLVLNQKKAIGEVKNVQVFSNQLNEIPAGGFGTYPSATLSFSVYICWEAPSDPVAFYIVEFIPPPLPSLVTNSIIRYKGTAAFFEYDWTGPDFYPTFSVRAFKNDVFSNSVIKVSEDSACFPAKSLVSIFFENKVIQKNIEDVCVGENVIGAFGEINQVVGLQRVFVGTNKLYKINDNHITTDHHPHVTPSKTFLVCDGLYLLKENLYGKLHQIYDGKENIEKVIDGLNISRISLMKIGDELKTLNGSCKVLNLEEICLESEEILYNLVIDGSHTYHVDEFAVTGWPSEKDFDYDLWI